MICKTIQNKTMQLLKQKFIFNFFLILDAQYVYRCIFNLKYIIFGVQQVGNDYFLVLKQI